ncbi:MAG: hypothetical protein V4629_06365 [Pseudomonadota bacterium]
MNNLKNDCKALNQSDTTSINKTSISDKLITTVLDAISPDRHVPLGDRLKNLTNFQKSQLQEIEEKAIINFSGTVDELESALGMLRIGHHMGWKMLYVAHSKKTIRKYEEILNIKIRDIFDEEGPSSKRSIGLALASKYSNFWKVVSGDIKIENRKKIE